MMVVGKQREIEEIKPTLVDFLLDSMLAPSVLDGARCCQSKGRDFLLSGCFTC
jgi:hypothetical protein